ncbi:hypothetical protein PoB_001609000 [Plakobranchus ocellatus]|uniref:Uncharacterized protein n=1 Tax=Plakobranchus ocellatus TaxID=259542 RepID=A0AAV3Z2G6_9GAST|nr:hypothetical protein PoB_001609000 [Plakobranchus ocellatus]
MYVSLPYKIYLEQEHPQPFLPMELLPSPLPPLHPHIQQSRSSLFPYPLSSTYILPTSSTLDHNSPTYSFFLSLPSPPRCPSSSTHSLHSQLTILNTSALLTPSNNANITHYHRVVTAVSVESSSNSKRCWPSCSNRTRCGKWQESPKELPRQQALDSGVSLTQPMVLVFTYSSSFYPSARQGGAGRQSQSRDGSRRREEGGDIDLRTNRCSRGAGRSEWGSVPGGKPRELL